MSNIKKNDETNFIPFQGLGASGISTIAAISTAPGIGGIAIIRVSGKDALMNCGHIYRAKNNISLSEQKANTISFGNRAGVTFGPPFPT